MRNNAVRRFRGQSRIDVPPAPVEKRIIDPRVYALALRIVNGDKSRILPDPDCENGVIIKPERL